MPSSDNEKSYKKAPGTKASQPGSTFRFGKRQGSQFSNSSRSASESTTPLFTSEYSLSRPNTPNREDSTLSARNGTGASYSTQSAVRLVNKQLPSESDSTTGSPGGMNVLGVNTVTEVVEPLIQSPEAMSPQPIAPSKRMRRDASPPPSRTTTPVPSSPRIHWNMIRNAIVPGAPVPSSSRSLPSDAVPPQPSFTTAPPRPQTPKPSRFARLGFRQVVEHTRDLAHDETSRFEAEVYQACATARFGDVRQRVERDNFQQLYLPFVSTTSLPLSTVTVATQTSKSTQSNESIGRTVPSLKQLHQTLVRYASISSPDGTMARLPYESDVLSVLLIPFTLETGLEIEERWLAVETFEIAVKTWRGTSQQREVDRILWCCKAGCIPASPVRSRVLGTLSNLLFSSSPLQDADPLALQNVLQGLQLLLHNFSVHAQGSYMDTKIVHEFCARLSSGECGQLDVDEIKQEYGEEWSSLDTNESIRTQIAAEGVVRCMQLGSESLRRWILHNSIETYWPSYSEPLSPLCKTIVARRLSTFLRSSLHLLRSNMVQADHRLRDAGVTVHLLWHKALVELEQLPVSTHALDGRTLAVELLLYLLSIDPWDQRQRVVELICKWCDDVNGWKECLEIAVRFLVEKSEWSYLSFVLQGVTNSLPDVERRHIISNALPALHTRLVLDPPLSPLPALTSLLQSLVELYPQQFYKPLFSLAGASRDSTIVGQFAIVTALAQYLPEFWIRDSEMMSVALMSDVGSSISKGKAKEDHPIPWSRTRIGQSLIMLELIRCVKELTKTKKDPTSPPDGSHALAYRFITGLEARLAILLEAKEKSALIPFSHRILLSDLFREIRLFSRSLKPAPWLKKVVTWAVQSYPGASLQSTDNPFADRSGSAPLTVGDEAYDEVMSSLGKMQSIYVACWQSPPSNSQRGTLVLSTVLDPRLPRTTADQPAEIRAIREREELMATFPNGVTSATLRLLVAVCALLTQAEHHTLGPVLWSQFLVEAQPHIVAPACFLLTHCLEKFPSDMTKLIKSDKHSSDNETRRTLIRRLMTLYSWRSQLLSQTYIQDRGRRRPFKLARQPIAFVAIDVGSGSYVHEQTEEDRKNLPGGTLPLELRKRLAEVGWEQDDLPTDTRLETVRAPISLFPISQLDHINTVRDQATIPPSHSVDSAPQLLRRKSSSSSHHPGAKRRPVFVPALVSLFSSMAFLVVDSDPAVASAAREAMLLILRDDPVMLCRPVMDILSTDLAQVGEAISILRALLHIHHRLPPSASHHIFTHLGGFLKYVSRDYDTDPKALRSFSYTMPILSKLINQVSNLSIRDLRRSKFEIYVFPSGSLWFPSTAPLSTMFPQSLGPTVNPFDELPPQLVAICMIRTAQNMLLYDMLKQKPQELHTVRKALTGLVLPGENTGKELDAHSFLPRRLSHGNRRRSGYHQVSLALARSHLLLVGQVFRTMSRNFNGKAELARLFDGINRILLVHGDDIGIVAHASIACMIAVTRFKRFVSSNRGFTLFMPGLLKVYAEAEGHMGIRHAIQYASSRFYAIHEEAYLFQGVDLASSIIVRLERPEDQDWFAGKVWRLFAALSVPLHQGVSDAAGIRDCNMAEEREALIAATVIDETTQAVTQESPGGEQLKKILAVGQYDNKLLQLDDLAKLFLTVIAHDHTVIRSQNFLTLFRRMAPEFYNGSKSSREVLRDGINALGSALFAKAPRQKASEPNQGRPLQQNAVDAMSHESEDSGYIFDNPSTPCDHIVMRREYLGLVIAFTQIGGELRSGTVRRSLDLVKGLLKESTRPDPEAESNFLHKLTESSFLAWGISVKHARTLLHEVAPVIRAFTFSMDCSGVLDSVTDLLKRPELANDVSFVLFVVEQIIGPVLEACEDAASENLLMSLPIRSSIISLVCCAATLAHADVARVIEKQAPSPGFLAGIVLPLCLTIKTSKEMATDHQWQANAHTRQHSLVFVRLLAYAMDACRGITEAGNGRSSPLPALHRRDSERSKQSSQPASRIPLATWTIVVQIIKVIVIRAADDVSRGPAGIWSRVAQFLQQLLEDGNARFALSLSSSPTVSPWQSPQLGSSPSPVTMHGRTRSTSSDDHLSPSPSLNGSGAPRAVDYLAWSLMEFICCAPSPLTIQLRLWMQEKVHNLDAELKAREVPGPYITNDSRRLSSSVFARPRGSSTSPEGLRASHGRLSRTPSELNLSATYTNSTDFSAYSSRFPPPSPGSLQPVWSGPRIVHLGPTQNHQLIQPMVERSASQDSYLRNLARHAYIGLPALAQRTRERVRLVQTCMGYWRLLPVPVVDGQGIEGQNETVTLKAWTKASALRMLADEAKLVMDEFPECFHETLGGGFVDVPSNPAYEEPQTTSPKRQPILF